MLYSMVAESDVPCRFRAELISLSRALPAFV